MPTPEQIRDMEHRHERMSYNKIGEFIYAGNNMCCQNHFEEELLVKGISADISLEFERLDNPQGVKYFFWFPWKEDTAPSLELVDLCLDALDGLISRNVKTYIHCKNGHGRTTTLLASYFIREKSVQPREAIVMVKEKRPSAHLNEIQMAFLEDFDKFLADKKLRHKMC